MRFDRPSNKMLGFSITLTNKKTAMEGRYYEKKL